MSGFRKTAQSAETVQSRLSLFEQVISEFCNGKTSRQIAHGLGLPLDLIELMAQRAYREGRLEYYELADRECAQGFCAPDPQSFICAGCPLYPKRRHRSNAT
jgi:hypothetical protein